MIKTIKNSILFSALLLFFVRGTFTRIQHGELSLTAKNKCILPTLKASGKLTGKEKSER
jgi:hypothetical protein